MGHYNIYSEDKSSKELSQKGLCNFFMCFFFASGKNILLYLYKFFFWELRKHPICEIKCFIIPHSYLKSGEDLASRTRNNRFDSIMSTGASLRSKSNFSEFHTHIVKNHYDIFFRIKLIEITNCYHAFSGKIHKSERLQKKYFFSVVISFRDKTFEFRVFKFTTFPNFSQIIKK